MKHYLARLEESLAGLKNRLGHLESEVSAASDEHELTAMTIDSVRWPAQSEGGTEAFGPSRLLCHVVEWDGFGKMKRFTQKADPVFLLEASGYPAIKARMAEGGICDADGSTRLVILSLSGTLEPGVRYSLRPRNENVSYRWTVPESIVVARL